MKNFKKTALLQDIVCSTGGAELVLEVFLEMFPDCDLYTLFIVSDKRKKIEKCFPDVKIHVSIFQKLINNNNVPKFISVIKLLSWVYWKSLNLKKYDLIISSSHSYGSKNISKNKNGLHISYIHTPPRYLYSEFNEIGLIRKFPFNFLFLPIKYFLRWIDQKGSDNIDVLIANSKNVQKRIKKYYKKESVIIYPPVRMLKSKTTLTGNDYFICLSRLVKQKGIDLAVKTCTELNLPLMVVGDGPEFKKMKKIAGKNVKFIRNCSDKDKGDLLASAKALIYLSIEEDFGIVPVEAMSVGTPVIAFNSGGVNETVINNKTGILFDNYSEEGLRVAIDGFNKINLNSDDCIKQAKNFEVGTFKKRFLFLSKNRFSSFPSLN